MKNFRAVLVATTVAAMTAGLAMGGRGDTLGDWADGEKAYSKVWFGPGPNQLKKMKPEDFPRRVGLLSFYVFDMEVHESNAMAATYGGTYSRKFGLDHGGANLFATEFASLGVPVLKKRFAEHGMELLTPVEFLENQTQIDAYFGFRMTESGWQRFARTIRAWLDENPGASGAADGYAMIPTHLWVDPEILEAMDELRVTLGLDALTVLANTTSSDPRSVDLESAVLAIYGPNPEPRPPKRAKYWTPSLVYVVGTFGKGFKGAEFAWWGEEPTGKSTSVTDPISGQTTTYSGRPIERVEYEGYEGIIDGLARRTLEQLKKRCGR